MPFRSFKHIYWFLLIYSSYWLYEVGSIFKLGYLLDKKITLSIRYEN